MVLKFAENSGQFDGLVFHFWLEMLVRHLMLGGLESSSKTQNRVNRKT